MWMYLYYTMYLKSISTADRTDHQAFLYEQWVQNQNPGPFPIKRSMVLESDSTDSSSDDVGQGILRKVSAILNKSSSSQQDQLSALSANIQERIDDMRKKLSDLEKKSSKDGRRNEEEEQTLQVQGTTDSAAPSRVVRDMSTRSSPLSAVAEVQSDGRFEAAAGAAEDNSLIL